VTTEVWAFFDEMWAQQMYVTVSSWLNGMAQDVSPHPIFSVGADSRFYSPFWRMIYVEVPDGVATSVREILDGKSPLHPSRGWMAALTPGEVGLGSMPSMPSGGAVAGTGWLDGATVPFVKFPVAPFGIGPDEVIEEVPIFHFVFVKDDGTWVAPAIPPVLGTGPLYSQRPAPLDGLGVPTAKYSAYWRVYDVVVPPGAHVFAPEGSATAMALAGLSVSAAYDAVLDAPENAALRNDLLGRIVFNDSCLDTAAHAVPGFGPCHYLDSQYAIETMISQNSIVRTDVTVTCPLVSVNRNPVTP
jgi:hypothetical protein